MNLWTGLIALHYHVLILLPLLHQHYIPHWRNNLVVAIIDPNALEGKFKSAVQKRWTSSPSLLWWVYVYHVTKLPWCNKHLTAAVAVIKVNFIQTQLRLLHIFGTIKYTESGHCFGKPDDITLSKMMTPFVFF